MNMNMIYTLLPDTDPMLHKPVPAFDFSNPPVDPKELVANMTETMRAHYGFGLAGNQCGLPYRVFLLEHPDGGVLAAFNPEIVATTGVAEGKEGCLSFPGLELTVKRAAVVTLKAQDAEGQPYEIVLTGMHARGAQHETDHLNGITFTKRVSRIKLEMARKKVRRN